MGEWILIHSIFVYHPTSGLVKQPDIHSYTGHIRTKGHLPQIPGYSPWRENSPNSSWPHTEKHHACHADGSHSHSPSPSTQCTIPPGTATTVPIRDEHSCGCSRRSQPDPDTGSKPWPIVTKFPLRTITRMSAESLHIHQTFPHCSK